MKGGIRRDKSTLKLNHTALCSPQKMTKETKGEGLRSKGRNKFDSDMAVELILTSNQETIHGVALDVIRFTFFIFYRL